jgi:general secretion pathway protein K
MARATPNSERGFIIVAVLWMLAALATLASVYSIYASNTAMASHVEDDRLQAEASLKAGVELAAARLSAGQAATRSTFGDFVFRIGRSKVAVRYESEGARIDLNKAPKPLLVGLFTTIGLDAARAAYCADRIIGWRTKGVVAAENEEGQAYRLAGVPYPPRQSPFESILELPLVLGLSPDIVQRILPFVTVFNGEAEIDPATAAPEVLAALPGMNPQLLQQALAQRAQNPHDAQALQKALGPAGNQAAARQRKASRVDVTVDLDNGRRVNGEVSILMLEGADEPYRVLAWRDDFDGPAS